MLIHVYVQQSCKENKGLCLCFYFFMTCWAVPSYQDMTQTHYLCRQCVFVEQVMTK